VDVTSRHQCFTCGIEEYDVFQSHSIYIITYTVSRDQLKFKLEELIQLYLVLNTMGYHLKICTISYDDVMNSIQFYQI
jgi:hypothetical protein